MARPTGLETAAIGKPVRCPQMGATPRRGGPTRRRRGRGRGRGTSRDRQERSLWFLWEQRPRGRAGASLNNVSHSGAQRLLPGARRPVPSPGDPAWGQCLERVAWEVVVAWALDGCFVCEQRAGGEALILAGNWHTRRGTVPPRWPGPRRQGSDAPEMKDGARRSRLPGSQRGEDAAQLAKDPAVTSQDGDSECRYACEK